MKLKKLAADRFAKMAERAAISAAGAASVNKAYQPKEPKNIKEALAKNK